MGLLGQTTQSTYYNGTNKGNYTFVNLREIIDTFMVVYVGEGKILNKVNEVDVQFHGMRAIQELTYDVLKSHKSFEQEVPATLVMPLPQDYVNYTKVVRIDSNGIEKPIYPTSKTSNPFPISQVDGVYQFEDDGSLSSSGKLSSADSYTSTTRERFSNIPTNNINKDYDDVDSLELSNRGRRYGLDPQYAQSNGTFYIDESTGFIHFGSDLAGEIITLKYISDGLGTTSEMIVHKFAEEAVYKHIMYGLISGRTGIPEYVVARYKKEKFAESRKAKIRLSNIKIEEFTQVLKGLSKPIK